MERRKDDTAFRKVERMRKKYTLIVSILVVVVIVGAFVVANNIPGISNFIDSDWVGISVHALSANDARLVSESGAGWIRIDCNDTFEVAVKNANTSSLKVLGILDSWSMNGMLEFTLNEWRNNVTYYVSEYAEYVDAWEIWNEPANPAPNWTLLNLTIWDNMTKTISSENMTKIVDFYFSMAQTGFPIIRHYDPSAKIVLFGGLNLHSGSDPHLELDMEFSKQLATMNVEQFGDAISVHAYPWKDLAETSIWQKYDQSLAHYKGLFNKSLEIWLTETGQQADYGEYYQALYMANSLFHFDRKVTRLFWYSLLDNSWEDKEFGLISGAAPRTTYYSLEKAVKK